MSWERGKHEPAIEYEAFRVYLGVPGRRSFRTARKRAEAMGVTSGDYAERTWGRWMHRE